MSLPDTHPLRIALAQVEKLQPKWFDLSQAILEVVEPGQDYTLGELLDLLPQDTDPAAIVTAMIPLCSYENAIFNAGGFLIVGDQKTDLSNEEFSSVINTNSLIDPHSGNVIENPSNRTFLCFRQIPGSWGAYQETFTP
jgi:hypothetical protein